MTEEKTQPHILDRAVWASLSGPHAHFAEVDGMARRYPVDVSPFGAIADPYNPQDWRDLAGLIGPGGHIVFTGRDLHIADGWQVIDGGYGLQMTGEYVEGERDAEAIPLGVDDVPEMLDLVSRAEPGPFLPRTVELGGYLGIRVDGALVAMAGCRLHPTGWREISAVCTDASQRGKGLAGRLVKAVAAIIRAEGDIPFLHVSETNENAIRLYETLG
ncbi:MAG: GNAT family N-acetyltransferase, partial [Actinobacteria bacterium]|nr:GNAT family N-acetyltransferase [Actinomycetota bacterium]